MWDGRSAAESGVSLAAIRVQSAASWVVDRWGAISPIFYGNLGQPNDAPCDPFPVPNRGYLSARFRIKCGPRRAAGSHRKMANL